LVKFQQYWVKKRCKPGRGPYKYRGILLRIPKKFHQKVEPILGIDLTVKDIVVSELSGNRTITVVLTSKKNDYTNNPKYTSIKN
jgi:hypothetical protein